MVKVIASSIRKGNVLDIDGKLYVVLSAESFHPGKGEHFVFMEPQNYEQVTVSGDMVGDQSVYLQEGMEVQLSIHNGGPVAIELPARVVLEIVETEPVTKGQTASSSFKPAMLSNGVRTNVPPHISAGVRVVIQTEDGSYVERAKD